MGYFTAYVMEIDGEIVSAAFIIIDEKPPGLNNLNGRYEMVMNMFTYPEHRGKGYATSVMSPLIVDADNIFVSVSISIQPKRERGFMKSSVLRKSNIPQ